MNIEEYFKEIEKETKKVYDIAEKARAKGYDPVNYVEIPLARSLAEKVVGLLSSVYPQMKNTTISKRIIELEKEYGKLDPAVCLKIAEEVAKQKFCQFSSLIEAVEAGARTGIAYFTLGVVSSPIEGLTHIKVKKTKDGENYLCCYFSGPIRSAGGTGAAFSLIILDYLREMFGFSKYDPTEEEINRAVIEINDYHEKITNLQYFPTIEEIRFLVKNIPIQVDGDATETLEVSSYRNLKRIETNKIRGGFCLIIGEGIAQKAKKILRYVNSLKKKGFKISDWDFLEEYVKLHENREKDSNTSLPTYINDLVAGRPIFGHPSRSGAFRFRYGRSRNSGFSATSIHPATMTITENFIAIGTQLKLEKPSKGCVVTSCDSIDGPIVKLYNGSVKKIKSEEEAKKYAQDIEEIIYLGDILFPFSDLSNRNAQLIKPGYVEEIWSLQLKEKNLEEWKKIDSFNVSLREAIKLSKSFKIPLYPKYIFFWTQINFEQFENLIEWLKNSKFLNNNLILPFTKKDQERFSKGKRSLEILGVEHDFLIENVIVKGDEARALLINLGFNFDDLDSKKEIFLKDFFLEIESKFKEFNKEENKEKNLLSFINQISKFTIKDKAGEFIGARMGRPEKAKIRKLKGSPNVIFPVGMEGGRLRSILAACDVGKVSADFPCFFCEKCNKETIYQTCESCDNKCKKLLYCPFCKKTSLELCLIHQKAQCFYFRSIDIRHYLDKAAEKLEITKTEIPIMIKGVRGTSSKNHYLENLVKGILRAKYNLQVNKDGTIRFDATEMPLTCFKPKEISTSVEKLRELGYTKDIYGNDLISEDQLLELKPHDVLLPSPQESPESRADEVFIRVCHFIDELLEKLYGLPAFYNVKKREDLIGKLGVCIAPHNCAGVICRFIGFSNTLGVFASPYIHAAIRRDCDGDELALALLGDVLINFSREFLPDHRGATQDSPIVLNARIDAGEVDDQILDFELVYEYPLYLYEAAEEKKHSSEIKIYDVRTAIKEGKNPFEGMGFTHNTSNINLGNICSSYKLLTTMQEKLEKQMNLVEKIRAVDQDETARLVIEKHFLKDIKGNLRKFSTQEFRCVSCNEILRRPPLSGKCTRCKGKIIFTTNEGGIKKYLEVALELSKRYNLPSFVKQNLELTKRHIDSVFGKEEEIQESLGRWF
ncbi:MAG: DNA polymerase II large subunit [Candidatus Pacearchaeota archaeon]|nr:MAG: DNA polymerase II large subunit [Candidatus Pacearchaeota archaeon]